MGTQTTRASCACVGVAKGELGCQWESCHGCNTAPARIIVLIVKRSSRRWVWLVGTRDWKGVGAVNGGGSLVEYFQVYSVCFIKECGVDPLGSKTVLS